LSGAGPLLEGRLVEVADTTTFFESTQDPRTAALVRGEMVYGQVRITV
jgi:ABC-type phosphate transport system ATPase subunit